MTKEKPKRAYRKKTDPHGSGVNHPFGAVHPLTEGQKKIVAEFLDEKLTEKLNHLTRPMTINIVNPKGKYFNWKDIVWSTALGIALGVIIAHL